jgi:hypothetical protein
MIILRFFAAINLQRFDANVLHFDLCFLRPPFTPLSPVKESVFVAIRS